VYIGAWGGVYIYRVSFSPHGVLAISGIPSKKWFPRLSTKVESLGNSIFTPFKKNEQKHINNYVACNPDFNGATGFPHFSKSPLEDYQEYILLLTHC
jgi:hypothetical protein